MPVCVRCASEHPEGPCPASGCAPAVPATGLTPRVTAATRPAGESDIGNYPVGEPNPYLGRMLGSYRLTRLLGRGGMGTVYLGEHQVIGSRVAVKILHAHFTRDRDLVQRFFAEAQAANLIRHENIVQIFDLSMTDTGDHYLVMEYLEGETLANALTRGPMSMEAAVPILMQVAGGLSAAHARGVIHRDLKPDNLFLVQRSGAPLVKILDFGIAKLHAKRLGEGTVAGAILGTPHFMAPEQAGGVDVDARADVYSLGLILYRIATGRLAFDASSLAEVLVMQAQQAPDPPRSLNASLSHAVEAVILKALAKRPQDRFQGMTEMGDALRKALAQGPPTPRPAPSPERDEPAEAVTVVSAGDGGRSPFRVRVQVQTPARFKEMYEKDIASGGMFVGVADAMPAAFTPIEILLVAPDGSAEVDLKGEVVYVISRQDAASMGRKPGVGVQLAKLDAGLRQRIEAIVSGARPPPSAAETPTSRPGEAERLVLALGGTADQRPYEYLGVPLHADASQVRDAARKLLRDTDPARLGAVSPALQAKLAEIRDRIRKAQDDLTDPKSRAEHDAARGNWMGVARALAEGLKLSDMALLRRIFLASREKNELNAQAHIRDAVVAERTGGLDRAVALLQKALEMDPLNIALHHRYQAAKREQIAKKKK